MMKYGLLDVDNKSGFCFGNLGDFGAYIVDYMIWSFRDLDFVAIFPCVSDFR